MNHLRYMIILTTIFCISSSYAAKNDFFEQNYRGWLWFEEKDKKQDNDPEEQAKTDIPTKEQMRRARIENEEFKEELESLRHLMVRHPNNLNYTKSHN